MNVSFFTVLLLEIVTVITQTEAKPSWSWGSKPRHKQWNWGRSDGDHICSEGQCVKAWKCPESSISQTSTGSCYHWRNGPWVCCVLKDASSSESWENRNTYSTLPPRTLEITKTTTWKRYPGNNPTNNHDDEENSHSFWNRNAGDRPRSFEDIYKDIWDKTTTPRPWHTTAEFPHHLPKRTTPEVRNKRTSVDNKKSTTSSWIKPHTSVPRIVFPTESVPTQNGARNRTYDRKTTKRSSYVTTEKWSRSSTSLPTRRTMGYASNSTSRLTTAPTRRPAYSSTRKWSRSTIRTPVNVPTKRTTKYPSYTIKTSTDAPNERWSRPAAAYPTRTQTKKPPRTNKPPPTMKTTKPYRKSTPLPNFNTHLCGLRDISHERNARRDDRGPYQRIVGGEEAEPFSWPWVAALYKVSSSGGHRFLSAGSLINENYILTAAHVFTPDDLRSASYVVMLGTHDAQDAVAEYTVTSVLQHPEYEHRYYYHDIALLKLGRPVAFNNYVMPICLPSPNAPLLKDANLQGKNVTVMGWGDDSFGGKGSRVLKEVTFPIVSRISCNASYVRVASNRFPRGITDNMLCAGDPDGRKDACQGDSGGPLTSVEEGRYVQVGIVSFGYKCGDKEFPGVYTKVASYLNWIRENA